MAKASGTLCTTIKKVTSSITRNYSSAWIAPLQKAALEERCILVDEFDRPLGEASKRDCHSVSRDGNLLLHRAFSVFLFNRKGDLLIQKRSSTKVTFPDHYTNTCCSHPLAEIPGETVEEDALGIRRAAQRRLSYELGIPTVQVQPFEFFYLTRIHYQSIGDGQWGEHEIDYVLFLQKDNVTLYPNPDEVSEIHWVPRLEIDKFVKEINSPLTPWFQLMLKHKLFPWWDNLHCLKKMQDLSIQRYL